MIESTTLIGVLVGFTLLGIILGRMTSKDSVDDFALGGRSLGFFPSLMTLSGTFVSAVTLMVYTSFVYIYGISAAWIFIGYTLGFLLFIPFALKLYRLSIEHKFFTLTDYFVFRYGRKTARWVIGVIFVWYVGLLSTQLLVGSNLLNELGGIDVNWAKLGMLLELAMSHLAKQFYDRTTQREYIAIVWGNVKEDEGTITGHIGRSLSDRLQMAVFEDGSEGKHAVTHYKVLQRFGYVTVVSCKLETGRTHQIRVHMKYLGHPLFNDERYGGDKILKGTTFTKYKQFIINCFKACPRHALHAKSLGFTHPKTGEQHRYESVLPEDMQEVIRKFEAYTSSVEPNREDEE